MLDGGTRTIFVLERPVRRHERRAFNTTTERAYLAAALARLDHVIAGR